MPDRFANSSAVPPGAPSRARRAWRGPWLVLLLVVALAGSAWYLVQRAAAPQDARGGTGGGPSIIVGTAAAQRGELPVLIEALGTVTPINSVSLVPQVSGVLTEILFTEGQRVRKGELLARIDPRPFEQALAQARGARARNEAQLGAARLTLQRYQTLWQQDSIARQEVDTQMALVKQLEAMVQSDRAAEQAAGLNLGYSRLVAPIGGRIGLRAVNPGNMVTAGSSTGIAVLTQMAPIDVGFAVPQDRVPDVLAAQRAGVLPVAALDRMRQTTLAQGEFFTLDNTVDTATGTVRAKARFANADGQLFPNQFVNVRLQLGRVAGVLVPVTAVRTGPQGDYVYVVDGERVARMRPVKRGIATAELVEIRAGLADGETVVTEGGDRVKDGGRVQRAEDLAAARAPGAAPDAASRAGGSRRRDAAASSPGAAQSR